NVELLQPSPVLRELVEIRGLDVGAMEADVLPAEIVGDDVDDVRPSRRQLRQCRRDVRRRHRGDARGGERRTSIQQNLAAIDAVPRGPVGRTVTHFVSLEVAYAVEAAVVSARLRLF